MNPRQNQSRLYFFLAVFLLLFIVAAVRLAQLSLWGEPGLAGLDGGSGKRASREARGAIYDAKGIPLALSTECFNIYLNAKKGVRENQIPQISQVTGLTEEKIRELLAEPKVHLLARFANAESADQIRRSRVDALLLEKVYKREYPQGKLLAQTVGFTGYEGLGFMGVERSYQELLSSNDTSLYLTIDSSLQFVAEKALEEAIVAYHARGGVVVIQDPRMGKILSLAASPSFDPNGFETTDETLFRNAAVSEPVEPGSIFKVFFIAHLLDRFQLDLDKPYFYCEEETVLGNGEVIRDFKTYGWVGFRDIVKYSINGGIIQATRGLSKREMYDYLWSAQFGQTTGVDLPFEHKGILRPTKEWGIRTAANIPMGQGVAVTSIQLISSFSALVNGGVYHKPYVLDRYTAPARFGGMATNWTETSGSRRIVSEEASKRVTSLLSYGTMRGSTGYRARESGYDAGGKTSTSQQVNLIEGGYFSNRFNALFIAAFPEEEPRATVLVVIFDPQDAHSGGQVAAPVFARLVPDLIRFAGLPNKGKMETYQNHILKIVREETRTKGNLVPDFRGLSLRSALALGQSLRREVESHSFNVRVESSGSGYVRNQSPPAGTPVTGDTLIRLILGEP